MAVICLWQLCDVIDWQRVARWLDGSMCGSVATSRMSNMRIIYNPHIASVNGAVYICTCHTSIIEAIEADTKPAVCRWDNIVNELLVALWQHALNHPQPPSANHSRPHSIDYQSIQYQLRQLLILLSWRSPWVLLLACLADARAGLHGSGDLANWKIRAFESAFECHKSWRTIIVWL